MEWECVADQPRIVTLPLVRSASAVGDPPGAPRAAAAGPDRPAFTDPAFTADWRHPGGGLSATEPDLLETGEPLQAGAA